ncbi:hypothetical protein BC827DRAFT_1269990 [Russula dissimulans]|nr:hypothetical protein BC827DRAFT_1269990 [Russula dissimulans]
MWAKLSNALKHRPTVDETEPSSADLVSTAQEKQANISQISLHMNDLATVALTDAMRPSMESTRPETPMDGGHSSLRSILRDCNTPATGQSVRYFSRVAYRVMTPEGSATSEQGDSPIPENPRLNDTNPQAQLSPSGSRHRHCVRLSVQVLSPAKFCGETMKQPLSPGPHDIDAKRTKVEIPVRKASPPASASSYPSPDSPTEDRAETAVLDPDLHSLSFHSRFWLPFAFIIDRGGGRPEWLCL